MIHLQSPIAVMAACFFYFTAGHVIAQVPAKPAPAMERTEHQ